MGTPGGHAELGVPRRQGVPVPCLVPLRGLNRRGAPWGWDLVLADS